MILLNIITKKEEEIEKLIEHVLKNKFTKSVQLDHEIFFNLDETGKIIEIKTPKISFITKALLYKEIEDSVFGIIHHEEIIIYAIPVGSMNEQYGNELRKFIKAA
ncbi:MAG: hypothetical protein JNK50_13565 [Bacteroidia bacterium]|nr:hypothetical protein [Bacteroidia bacterium]